MHRYLATLILALASLTSAAEEPLPAELPPEQEEIANRAAESAGMAIYRHDRAASVATDAVRGLRAFRKDKRLRGWITEETSGGIVVTFFGSPGKDQSLAALYRVQTSADGQVVGDPVALESPVPLTPFEASAATARATAVASGFEPCARQYNTVVLPVDDGPVRRWVVYLLAATTDADVVPVGGTYRIDLDADGATVMAKRPFTRTCITLPRGSKGQKVVALSISHLLDPTPTEAHVFWSLWSGLPFYVMTPPNGTVWGITNGRIRRVERRGKQE
jgi:hypothetical protein